MTADQQRDAEDDFKAALHAAFAKFDLAFEPRRGDAVPPEYVGALHSRSLTEDGQKVIELFDVQPGCRTGMRVYLVGAEPGQICYAD